PSSSISRGPLTQLAVGPPFGGWVRPSTKTGTVNAGRSVPVGEMVFGAGPGIAKWMRSIPGATTAGQSALATVLTATIASRNVQRPSTTATSVAVVTVKMSAAPGTAR